MNEQYERESKSVGCTGQSDGNKLKSGIKKGISFGSCLAMILSYTAWQSIPWAILHGLMSWVYVVYYVVKY